MRVYFPGGVSVEVTVEEAGALWAAMACRVSKDDVDAVMDVARRLLTGDATGETESDRRKQRDANQAKDERPAVAPKTGHWYLLRNGSIAKAKGAGSGLVWMMKNGVSLLGVVKADTGVSFRAFEPVEEVARPDGGPVAS